MTPSMSVPYHVSNISREHHHGGHASGIFLGTWEQRYPHHSGFPRLGDPIPQRLHSHVSPLHFGNPDTPAVMELLKHLCS